MSSLKLWVNALIVVEDISGPCSGSFRSQFSFSGNSNSCALFKSNVSSLLVVECENKTVRGAF